jgi:2-oxoglutarate/2-oxoacid ferredoxin oxidoreductase subunit beta
VVTKEKVAGAPELWNPQIMPSPLCPGCWHGTISALIGDVLDEMKLADRTIMVSGAGCAALAMAGFPVDRTWGAHGRPPDIATGVKRIHPDAMVFTIQGDGDLLAIGSDPFIGVLTRGEMITIIMLNNTNFGTTGGQVAPTSLIDQVTPTTPLGRQAPPDGYPVHAAEVAAQFKSVAYSARGSVDTIANYRSAKKYVRAAFQKQVDNVGLSFVEIISACPVQWHMTPVQAVERVKAQVLAEFPLGEFKNVDKLG